MIFLHETLQVDSIYSCCVKIYKMKKIDKSRMDSFTESDKVLDKNALVYEADAPAKEQKQRFTGYRLDLVDLAEKMDKPTRWLTKQKHDAEKALLAKLFPFSNALVCFANRKSDDLMLANVKLSKSEQKGLSDTDLLVYSKQLIDIARENLS